MRCWRCVHLSSKWIVSLKLLCTFLSYFTWVLPWTTYLDGFFMKRKTFHWQTMRSSSAFLRAFIFFFFFCHFFYFINIRPYMEVKISKYHSSSKSLLIFTKLLLNFLPSSPHKSNFFFLGGGGISEILPKKNLRIFVSLSLMQDLWEGKFQNATPPTVMILFSIKLFLNVLSDSPPKCCLYENFNLICFIINKIEI